MPTLSFEIKDGKIIGREWLWNSVKRFFQTILADGRYVWPMPEKERLTRSIQQNNMEQCRRWGAKLPTSDYLAVVWQASQLIT